METLRLCLNHFGFINIAVIFMHESVSKLHILEKVIPTFHLFRNCEEKVYLFKPVVVGTNMIIGGGVSTLIYHAV